MRGLGFIILACLLTFGTVVQAQTKLLYPQEQAVKRQTMNMNEIERELDQKVQQGGNAAINSAQEMLIAQFNQMLANDPNLKAQFDAATAEQQAAFMLQFGIVTQAAGQGDQFTDLLRRLDGIIGDLEASNVPTQHPDVSALLTRVDVARSRIAELQQRDANKTEQAIAGSDLSDFPDFNKDLETATKYAYALRDALLASRKIVALSSQRPGARDPWLIENKINSYELQRFKYAIDKIETFEIQVNGWTGEYQPLLSRSQTYRGQWQEVRAAFVQIAGALKAESPQAIQTLSAIIEHNLAVISYMVVPDENDATGQRMASIMMTNRVRNPGRPQLDGLTQTRANVELALSGYPIKGGGGAVVLSNQESKLENADSGIANAVGAYAKKLAADQRMPSDAYDGDDRDDVTTKAVTMVKQLYKNAEIHSVAVCCDWENVKYSEEIIEPDGRKWINNHDYRQMQIAVALIENETDAKMVVIGVLQNFISNEELVEFLAERPILKENL